MEPSMTVPAYPAYKDSGVSWLGEVPGHWELSRIGSRFTERREKVSDTDFPPLSVTKHGIVPQLETAAKTDDNDNRKGVRAGDFVINSRSDRKGSSGLSSLDGSVSLINTVIRPDDTMHGAFVHHLLRSVAFQEEYYRYGKGIVADLWSTNYGEMKAITLAVPPIGEQESIAAFLDRETAKIDALVAEQERLIALLKEKRQAVISHAVTKGLNPDAPMKDSGIEWLGEIPAHWDVVQLRRVIKRIEQGWSPECESRPAEEGEWGILKAGCVNRGVFRAIENKALPPSLEPIEAYEVLAGDVLISRANGNPDLVGSCAFIDETRPNLMLSDKIFRVALNAGSEPRWFAYAMGSASIRLQIRNAISGADGLANNLPQSALKGFVVPLPTQEEQVEISSYIDAHMTSFRGLIEEAEAAITLLQERRAAMIAAAVTGKIDVRGLVDASSELEAA